MADETLMAQVARVGGAGVVAGQRVPMGLERLGIRSFVARHLAPQVGDVPDQGRGILAAGDERVAIGCEGDGIDRTHGVLRVGATPGRWRGPKTRMIRSCGCGSELLLRGPTPARGQQSAVGREGQVPARALLPRQRRDLLTRVQLPEPDRRVCFSPPPRRIRRRSPQVARNRESAERAARVSAERLRGSSGLGSIRMAGRASRPEPRSQMRAIPASTTISRFPSDVYK